MKKVSIIIMSLLFFMVSCVNSGITSIDSDELLRKQVAGMLCVGIGFDGVSTELSEGDRVILKELEVGGVILMNKWRPSLNKDWPKNLPLFMKDIKRYSQRPMLYAVDQEGGRVSRLSVKKGFPNIRFPQEIGDINDDDTTRYYACKLAKLVQMNGFNTNFAPSVDLNLNPDSPVIGKLKRSFNEDANVAAHIAEIYYDEHYKSSILTAYKHFPGHGSSTADSHKKLTDITDTWQKEELLPYQKLIEKNKCDMVMVGHLYNAHIDEKYPASLSRKAINDLLISQLAYKGVIVSDDMVMNAITNHYDIEEYLKLSINAGMDLLIFSRGGPKFYGKIIDVVVMLVEKGEIPRSRIEESYLKVLNLCRKTVK